MAVTKRSKIRKNDQVVIIAGRDKGVGSDGAPGAVFRGRERHRDRIPGGEAAVEPVVEYRIPAEVGLVHGGGVQRYFQSTISQIAHRVARNTLVAGRWGQLQLLQVVKYFFVVLGYFQRDSVVQQPHVNARLYLAGRLVADVGEALRQGGRDAQLVLVYDRTQCTVAGAEGGRPARFPVSYAQLQLINLR